MGILYIFKKGKRTECGKSLSDYEKNRDSKITDSSDSGKRQRIVLWVTAPCLIEGIELISSWGFTYKTMAFTWVKQNRKSDGLFTGMGYYTRANAEFCLLATRGKNFSAKVSFGTFGSDVAYRRT